MTPEMVARYQDGRADVLREQDRRRYVQDPWSWITETVFTVDELDKTNPVKPFPVAACGTCQKYLGHAEAARCARCGGRAEAARVLGASDADMAQSGSWDFDYPEGSSNVTQLGRVFLARMARALSAA
jgi:hypothetical protein